MKYFLLAIVLLSAASCGNPVGLQDGSLNGYWRSPTASLTALPGGVEIWDATGWGQTDGAVEPGFGGKIQEYGEWAQSAEAGGAYRRVRYTGTLNPRTGWLLVIVADSASGERFFVQWLKPAPLPLPPPPAPTP